jgi:hypothetical protein
MGGLRNGPATPASDATLDRETRPEGLLRYQNVFEPSVSPWKRSAARDQVVFDGSEIALRASVGEPSRVSVAGAPPSGFDSFRARVRVRAGSGVPVPIPSVAPDMRVHALRVSPIAGATIHRDPADNYTITFERSGQFDVEFDVSAPQSYFGGPLPSSGATPGPSTLPDELMPAAQQVLEAIGITRGMTEVHIAQRLSDHFGSFEARDLAPAELSEDVYTDLALGRVGVCRHRAMTFVITAAAAGLRARYINNEAHAFVEVYFTNHGYRRFDLGGASAGLETVGGPGDAHRPQPSPREPSSFSGDRSPYPRVERAVSEPPNDDGSTEETHTASPPDPAARNAPTREVLPDADDRERTLLTVRLGADRAFRGDELSVASELRGLESGPIANAEIGVRIIDRSSGYTTTLGVLRTGSNGGARATFELPASLPNGRLNVELSYDGSAEFAPSEVR